MVFRDQSPEPVVAIPATCPNCSHSFTAKWHAEGHRFEPGILHHFEDSGKNWESRKSRKSHEMSEWIPVKEAAPLLGSDRSVVTRWCKKGKIPSRTVKKGDRTVYEVHRSAFDREYKVNVEVTALQPLLDEWEAQQKSGYHTGRPIGERGIQANNYGMDKFWQFLGKKKALANITLENLKVAISNVPVDYENQNCHFSQREQMHKSIRSFYKYLVRNGYKTHASDDEWKELKPKRIFDPKKPSLKLNQLEDLLRENKTYRHGRTPFDIELTHTMIMLMAMAGLRRAEMIRLEVHNVDMVNREIEVIDGKGNKDRTVGMTPELYNQIRQWLKIRPKSKKYGNILLQDTRVPLDGDNIRHRLNPLGKRIKARVVPHGLRRTFATIMEAKGMPWSYIQNQLGHADIKTTQEYVMPDTKAAAAWLKNNGVEDNKQNTVSKPELVALLEAVNKL